MTTWISTYEGFIPLLAGIGAVLAVVLAVLRWRGVPRGWSLDRMPAVDRVILRVGAWELLCNDEVPDGVAVAEAVSLAQQLSTDESPEFVNGLLGRLQQVKPTLLA